MLKSFLVSILFLVSTQSLAFDLIDGRSLKIVKYTELIESLKKGTILIISEYHDNKTHHDNQFYLSKEIQKKYPIEIGMEFLSKSHQNMLSEYLYGNLSEKEFLKQVGWGGVPFDFYRRTVLLPVADNRLTYGINAERYLTKKISQIGIKGLTKEEKKQIPNGFKIGNKNYFERFKKAMGNHIPKEKLNNYFEAQSVWDETMAQTSIEIIKRNPDEILIIIVGDFHASWYGGLPHRIKKRGYKRVKVISQFDATHMSQKEIQLEIQPRKDFGIRADYIIPTQD